MKQKTKKSTRVIAILLCALTVFGILPLTVSGASRVNIESSETGTKYFEYLSGSGNWTDLKNSVHWIVETGEIAYCLQNKKDSPHAGDGYEEFDPYTSYSTRVYNGLTIILESGFPADKPSYLTDDEARYATANAIRFWLAENGDPNFYSYHDRERNQIRAKSGYEDVLAWADALLEKARNQEFITSEVNFAPSNLVLTESGGKLTGATTVDLVNLNGGYTLDKSTLPSGVEINGFTGKDGDVLTISAPTTADLKFTLTATGLDNRTTANMFWYAPTNSANQTLVTFAEGNFAPKEAGTFTVSSTGTPTPPDPEEPEDPEEPVTGGISVQKINSNPSMGNHPLSGAQFGIYKDGSLVTTLTTNSAGVASVDGLELGTYTVREITAPWGFVLSSSSVSVTVSSSVTEHVSIGNKPQVGTITVTKEDSETGNVAQGDAVLEGAKYEVRDASGSVVDTLNALGTRVVTSRQLPLGTYYIHETQPPVGYLLNSEPIRVVISYAGQNVEVTTASTVCEDDVIKGQISIVKFGSRELTGNEQDPDIKPPLEGVEFEIRLKSSGVLYDTLVTDADGKAISDLLPYGTYIISETTGIDGYKLVEPFEVFVSEHGKEYSYILEDKTVEMRVKLVKTDSVTGNIVPIAGTTFRIENSIGEPIAFDILYPQPHTLDRFTTDASGTLYLPAVLPYGTYRLYEVDAPEGYLLEDDYVTFNVNEDVADYNTITVKFPNKAVMGTISIEKQGEMLTGVTIEETKYGEMHIPEYSLAGVEDAVFAIYAAENIGTPDGTVYYKEGQLVQEVTTDERGYATTKELYLGKYEIVEKSVPLGFVLDETPHYATLEYADQHTEVVTEIVGLENERQKAEIQIAKSAEYFDPENAVFETIPGEGFVFGVYTAHNIFGVIEENTLVDVITTDENGRATTTTDLPVAKYYVKELAAPTNAYIMIDGMFDVDVSAKNNIDAVFIDDTFVREPFFNEQYKSKISIMKTEAGTDTALQGAKFKVKNTDGNVLVTITTNETGYAETPLLPIGKYTVQEVEAPTGYKLTDAVYEVEITPDSEDVLTYDITNEPIIVEIFKHDITTDEVLEGAMIEVRDEFGNTVFTGTTDENGKVRLERLPAGKYTWIETIAPAGYAINVAEFAFEVDVYGVITGETKMTDEPITLEIEKIDGHTLESMANVVFSLLDEEGNPVKVKAHETYLIPAEDGADTFMVGTDGKVAIKYLVAGNYTLVEQTPSGYIPVDARPIVLTDEYGESNPYREMIYNYPTALVLEKTDKLTMSGMPNVEFALLDENGKPVRIVWNENGYFVPAEDGAESFLVDSNGFAKIMYIPLGKYTLNEVVPSGYIPVESVAIEITGEHTEETPYSVKIENIPTALNLYKVKSEDGTPLTGAGFTFKVSGGFLGMGFDTLKFTRLDDGRYMVDEEGTITEIMVDELGKISVVGLPLGDVHIEETTVPEGYFPIAPQKVTITAENTIDVPLELTVKNDVFVKLGLDTDKYNVLIAISVCLIGVGVIVWRVVRAKKNKDK